MLRYSAHIEISSILTHTCQNVFGARVKRVWKFQNKFQNNLRQFIMKKKMKKIKTKSLNHPLTSWTWDLYGCVWLSYGHVIMSITFSEVWTLKSYRRNTWPFYPSRLTISSIFNPQFPICSEMDQKRKSGGVPPNSHIFEIYFTFTNSHS